MNPIEQFLTLLRRLSPFQSLIGCLASHPGRPRCGPGGAVLLACLMASAAPGRAEEVVIPEALNYQGRLQTLDSGTDYKDGTYDIEFRIYNKADKSGTLLWGEKYSVYVKGGRFNVVLQSGTGGAVTNTPRPTCTDLRSALRTSSGDTDRFLGITVLQDENNARIASPSESFPRQQLLATAFAFQAQYAQYAAASPTNDAFTVGNGLTVQNRGRTLIQNALEGTAGLTVSSGATTLGGGLTVSGGSANLNAGLAVANNKTTLGAGLTVNGGSTLNGGVTVSGGATLGGGATVSGDAKFSGALTVTDKATYIAPGEGFGLRFPDYARNPYGDTNDVAFLDYSRLGDSGGNARLRLRIGNDSADTLELSSTGQTHLWADDQMDILGAHGIALRSSGTINLTAGSGTNAVQIFGNVSMMKGWVAKDLGTQYLAETDGFVMFIGYDGHFEVSMDDDDNGDPWYLQVKLFFTTAGADTCFGSFPVKKGTAWKVNLADSNKPSWWHIRWMPLGK
jgi:hypothetical protein